MSSRFTPPGTLAMVLHLSKAVHRASSDELLGMRLRQFLVLSYLRERSPSRQQDLCETLMLDGDTTQPWRVAAVGTPVGRA